MLEERDPVIVKNIFRSVENVNLATVIAYKQDGVKHHFLEGYDAKGKIREPEEEHETSAL